MVLASFKDHLLRIKAAKVVPWVAVQFVLLCLLSVSLFGIFRVILLLTELDRVVLPDDIPTIISALVMGLRFDIVITGYLLIAPFTILSLASLIRLRHAAIRHVVRYAILLSFALAFLVCAIDIPYFNHFYSRFSVSAFQWTDTPDFMIKMIIQEPAHGRRGCSSPGIRDHWSRSEAGERPCRCRAVHRHRTGRRQARRADRP